MAPPSVRTSRFGANAVAVGAAALARYRLTRPALLLSKRGAAVIHNEESKEEIA